MSGTTALGVTPDRRPVRLAEFRNGWGWSPSIWDRLLRHHRFDPAWVVNGTETDKGLNWLWHNIESLPEWEQAALVLTFDTGVNELGRLGAEDE